LLPNPENPPAAARLGVQREFKDMAEARKLDRPPLPEIPVDRHSPANGSAPSAILPPLPQALGTLRDSLEPAPVSSGPSAHAVEDAATSAVSDAPGPVRSGKRRAPAGHSGGAGRAFVILSLIGFLSFAAGAGLTAGIVLGNFDMKTGKVRETLQSVKTIIQQLRS
jgi:hypothetical protein